ncbi:MAG: heme biosynthesis HemY N-terminal domain-containing protein [Pseudomonadota bacterium]
MLWSLSKVLLFLVIVAALTLGAGLLLELDGGITVQVPRTALNDPAEFSLTPIQLMIVLALFVVALWLLFKLTGLLIATLKFINGDETAISRYFDRNRERRGFEALSEGLVALASGEGKLALAKAAKAERYLNRPELTDVVTAQAAELTGDRRKAEEVYKRLLKDDRTRFVGVNGLLKQKLIEGETETALKLAEKAFALKPKHVETQDTLLKLQAGEKDWSGARSTLGAKLKHGSLPRDVHRRRDAVMAISQARTLRTEGKLDQAQELAIEANRLSPELIPAAVMAAQAYVEQEKPRYATRVLKAAWDSQPHPELAAAFAAIAPGEESGARIKRFKSLTRSKPSHSETKMVMAELFISAEDYPAARRAIGDLAESDPSTRAWTIMAAIARGEGADDAVIRELLTKAITAPPDPVWICDVCGHIQLTWDPTCDNCGAIDTLSWRRPQAGELIASGPAAKMLPMIAAAPAPTAELVEDALEEAPALPEPEIVEAEVVEGQAENRV